MAPKLILITGVSGFIGFKTVILALEAGERIRAVVRRSEQIEGLKSHPRVQSHAKNIEFVVVPDLARSTAFDTALNDVTGIPHPASPLAIETNDYEYDIVQPAIDVTTSVLEAASRASSIKRVVITSSAVTLIPFEWLSNPDINRIYTELDLNSDPTRPFKSSMEAYWASKALTRIATRKFMENKPHFEIINLLPSVVIGPYALATSTSSLLLGTRASAMAPILGQKLDIPLVGAQVSIDDVVRAHVDALKENVPGNKEYILTSDGVDGIQWDYGKEIVRNGVQGVVEKLKLNGSMPTIKWKVDASAMEEAFGWKFKSFEETMKELVGQYLEMLEAEKSIE